MHSLPQIEKFTIEKSDGILPWFEIFYVLSIIYSAERSLAAFIKLETAVSNTTPCADEAFSSLQEALTHAAALSRFFKSTNRGGQLGTARSDKLKVVFSIGENSPLISSSSRDLRNTLEHFDEKLDKFLLGFQAGTIIPVPVIGNLCHSDEVRTFFKLIDPSSHTCVILGEKFDYSLYQKEVMRVLEIANSIYARSLKS